MVYQIDSQMVCATIQNTNQLDDFQKVGVLVNQLLSEKGNEFFELKKENVELKERVSKLEETLLKMLDEPVQFSKLNDSGNISNEHLEELVINYLKEEKGKGGTKIADFDIMEKFNVSIEQVDAVLEKLEKDGLIGRR